MPAVRTPAHLPARLTISLWDYSWFVRAGDVFADLDACFAEAVERGYNTVRVCAMPLLLFGEHDLAERETLTVGGLGHGYGAGTRWYDVSRPATIDPIVRLAELFRLARKYDVVMILSSWEFQQSPAFAASQAWFDMVEAIPPAERFLALADAFDRMLGWLDDRGLLDRVAYVELHNEVEYSRFPVTEPAGNELHQHLIEDAITSLRRRRPNILVTVSYAIPQVQRLPALAGNLQVAHTHAYVYGVLGALDARMGLDIPGPTEPDHFPNEFLQQMLRPDHPSYESCRPDGAWRVDASVLFPARALIYDYIDVQKYDEWLYAHYQEWRQLMLDTLDTWISTFAGWAAAERGIPAVLGEGYIGFTPIGSTFEDGPVGRTICEFAVRRAAEVGYWGAVLTSNAAPTHSFWQTVDWQRRLNHVFLQGPAKGVPQ